VDARSPAGHRRGHIPRLGRCRLASGSIQAYAVVIPWGRIGAALGGAVLVGVVAGLRPAGRNVLIALRGD
jgi:putative ABC transport system permease protein